MKSSLVFCAVIFCLISVNSDPLNGGKQGKIITLNPKDPSVRIQDPKLKIDLKGTQMGEAVKAISGGADTMDLGDLKSNELVPKGKSTRIRFYLPKDEKQWSHATMMGIDSFTLTLPKGKVNRYQSSCSVVVSKAKPGELGSAIPLGYKTIRSINFASIIVDEETKGRKKKSKTNGYRLGLTPPIPGGRKSEDILGLTHDSGIQHDISLMCHRFGPNVPIAHQPFEFESLLKSTGMDQYVKLELDKLPNYKVPEAPKPRPETVPPDGGAQPAAEDSAT